MIILFFGVAGTVQDSSTGSGTVLKTKDAETMYQRIDGPPLLFPVWFLNRSRF
jgi:hypothetical protein